MFFLVSVKSISVIAELLTFLFIFIISANVAQHLIREPWTRCQTAAKLCQLLKDLMSWLPEISSADSCHSNLGNAICAKGAWCQRSHGHGSGEGNKSGWFGYSRIVGGEGISFHFHAFLNLHVCPPITRHCTWGFIQNPVLSITSSGEVGFWEHDIEASKMQGRARGRKGEAQGVLSYQKATGIFDNPHIISTCEETCQANEELTEMQEKAWQRVNFVCSSAMLV